LDFSEKLLIETFNTEEFSIPVPNSKENLSKIAEAACYKSLQKIKAILKDDRLFVLEHIEEIVRTFEALDCGVRHDC